jgi:hypothetical protein
VRVLLDHNLSPAIAKALSALFSPQHEVVALRDKFDPSTPDAEWIELLGREGRWIVISGDRRITRNKAEYRALLNSNLIGFFLSKGLYKAKVIKQAERILALWDRMETIAQSVQGGALFELPMRSHLIKQLKD